VRGATRQMDSPRLLDQLCVLGLGAHHGQVTIFFFYFDFFNYYFKNEFGEKFF
jgi:hypothetical protein